MAENALTKNYLRRSASKEKKHNCRKSTPGRLVQVIHCVDREKGSLTYGELTGQIKNIYHNPPRN